MTMTEKVKELIDSIEQQVDLQDYRMEWDSRVDINLTYDLAVLLLHILKLHAETNHER